MAKHYVLEHRVDVQKGMEEEDRGERRDTTEAHHPEISKKDIEVETVRTSEALIRISRDLAKINSNVWRLERDLASAVYLIEELTHKLRAATEDKLNIETEIRREMDEKERLTAELTNARGSSAGRKLHKNLQLDDFSEVTKRTEMAASDDGSSTTYIGGLRTTDAEVKGVALLNSLIYVLYRSLVEGSYIRVFDDRTFRHTKVITLGNCVEPDGLVANPEAQCLYATDSQLFFPTVWKVTSENNAVTKWAEYQISLNLSVSLFGYVLVLYNSHDDDKYRLDVSLSTAKTLYIYELPLERNGTPTAVVETRKRNFVISYEISVGANKSTWSVYTMNANGQITCRFTPGDDPSQHLYNPRYLFVDSWDRVMVVDSGSNRVILLDPDLNWNRVLLQRSPLKMGISSRPLLYDNSTRRIFIAPSYEEVQTIDVYSLTLRPPEEMESKDDPSYHPPALDCGHINQLPDVVLEQILLKACLLKSSLVTEVLHALAAVDYNWYHKLKNERLHQKLRRKLAAQTLVVHCRKLTVRNNQKYLLENIRPVGKIAELQEGANPLRNRRDLVDRLHDAKCISDKQLRLLRVRSKRSRDVNKELLKIARSFDATQYATFVDCLRQTKQMTSSDVLERGGVTVEMKVILTKESKRFTEEIILTMNKIRDKMRPQMQEFEALINQLMVKEIEILGATKTNKDIIVIWLWCYSQESLSILREWNTTRSSSPSHLFVVTENLIKTISNAIVLKLLHIEEKQLVQEVSVCYIPIQIGKVRNIRGKEFFGVVKFKDKICILSQKPKLIQFCSQLPPFALVTSVEIKEIQNPSDMAAGPDCLYIKESFTEKRNKKEIKCLSKVIFRSEDLARHRVLRWIPNINERFQISACRDGSLLLMRESEPPILEIYGSRGPDNNDACSLVKTIKLDTDFCRIQHAVETETGNFVISHFLTNSSKCSISEINKSGQTVRRFYPKDNSQLETSACSLALDAYGRVFLADFFNNQVVLLDSQLKWIQVVLSAAKDVLTAPVALWYDQKMQQLIVAQRFTWKESSSTDPVTMAPAIYVVDIPALTEAMII